MRCRGKWCASDEINAIKPILQILMSVLLELITVMLMLLVPMLLVASPVHVTRDTLEVESHVEVSIVMYMIYIRHNNSADINECTSRIANCHSITHSLRYHQRMMQESQRQKNAYLRI